MKTQNILLALCLILSCYSGSFGQEKWSLEQCILHAQKSSIAVNQSLIGISQSEVTLDQAKQSRNPNLNANTNVNWNFGRTVDPTSNDFIQATFFSNGYSLSSGISLYRGFQIKNSIEQAKVDLKASKSDMQQTIQNVSLTVANNFLTVLFNQDNIKIAERQLLLNQQQLNQLNKSIAAGTMPEAERLNLEAQIAQSEQNLISARNDLDISILQLKQSLRLDPSYPLELDVPDDVPFSTDPDMVTFEEAFAEALKNRPDLQAAELRIASANLGTRIAKGALAPSITFGGSLGSNYSNQGRTVIGSNPVTIENDLFISVNEPPLVLNDVPVTLSTEVDEPVLEKTKYIDQMDQNLSYGFGFGISIPIYNNGSTQSSIQRAQLAEKSARLNYEQLIENLKIVVQQSLADAKASKKRLEASNKALEAQQLAFNNATKRLEIGATNTFEWESQKTQLENAEITNLIDEYNYLFNIKILEFYLGKPLKL
ncbi:MAG: TolC family protein [Saprospiraceae bacterium]|nr:TolC family protein [Saprospiraceae bacterium]